MRPERDIRPSLPDVVGRFASYREVDGNGAWGSLHCVLEDGNVHDGDVRSAIDFANEKRDEEGAALGGILLTMSRTQRLRLPRLVDEFVNESRSSLGRDAYQNRPDISWTSGSSS